MCAHPYEHTMHMQVVIYTHYTNMHIHTHTQTHTCAHTHTNTHMCAYTHSHMHAHTMQYNHAAWITAENRIHTYNVIVHYGGTYSLF